MPILYIMCGPSGCGKTTYIKNSDALAHCIHVSRDEIRYSIIKEGEDYFSHEKEVFRTFVKSIVELMNEGYDVIADATHLNQFSRRKLTQAIDMYTTNYKIIYIVFNVSADTCVARNANRTGRANVPENIIRNMCRDFRAPTLDEDERAVAIYDANSNDMEVKDCRNCAHGFEDEQFNLPLCHNNEHCKNFELWKGKE